MAVYMLMAAVLLCPPDRPVRGPAVTARIDAAAVALGLVALVAGAAVLAALPHFATPYYVGSPPTR